MIDRETRKVFISKVTEHFLTNSRGVSFQGDISQDGCGFIDIRSNTGLVHVEVTSEDMRISFENEGDGFLTKDPIEAASQAVMLLGRSC